MARRKKKNQSQSRAAEKKETARRWPSKARGVSDARQPLSLGQVAWRGAMVVAIAVWAYWPTLQAMVAQWRREPEYSHGFLVPLFSLFLLWKRRARFNWSRAHPSWHGVILLAAALTLRQIGGYFYFEWFETISLVPCLAGIVLLLFGWEGLRYSWTAIAFLVFMVPLPYRAAVALRGPLRTVATAASTYILQTVGLPAVSEGHVVVIDQVRIGIVEACSGLRMLVVFVALATAAAMVVRRPLWQRALIVASGIPIAVIANVARVSFTGYVHVTWGEELADMVFHDLAGWLMMPFALALLWLELWLLDKCIVIEPDEPLKPVLLAEANDAEERQAKTKKAESPAVRTAQ